MINRCMFTCTQKQNERRVQVYFNKYANAITLTNDTPSCTEDISPY
jgi:hypothetical protein